MLKRDVKYFGISLLLMLIAVFGLTACGGSSSGSSSSKVISGVASKGLIQGATVTVVSYVGGMAGSTLGSATTASDGSYSVSIGSYTGPVLVQVAGGSYTDETTLLNTKLTMPLHAMYGNVTGSMSISVTPLTEEAYQYAQEKFGNTLTQGNIDFANAKISNNCGFDIIATTPVDPTSSTSASAAEAGKEYGIYMAWFSGSSGLANIAADINNYINGDVFNNGPAVINTLKTFLASANNKTGISDITKTNEYLSLTLQPVIDNAVRSNNVPGVVMAVQRPGMLTPTWVGASGVSDLATGEPITANDEFRIGSISKTFVAMTVLKLAQNGLFSLDDPITKYLPQLSSVLTNYNVGAMTIRMLLNHTNGLFNYVSDGAVNPVAGTLQYDFEYFPLLQWTTTQLLQISNTDAASPLYASEAGSAFGFVPGSAWYYNDTGYIVLGMLIQQVTGVAWQDEVSALCLAPLGLQNTFIPKIGDLSMHSSNYAHGYVNWQDYFTAATPDTIPDSLGFLTERTAEDPSYADAAGAVISTPSDLLVWGAELAKGGTILNTAYQTQHISSCINLGTEVSPDDAGYFYCMGIMWEGPLVGHRGQIYGYDCSVQYLPAQDTTFAVCASRTLYNQSNTNLTVLNSVVTTLYPNTLLLSSPGYVPPVSAPTVNGLKQLRAVGKKAWAPLQEY